MLLLSSSFLFLFSLPFIARRSRARYSERGRGAIREPSRLCPCQFLIRVFCCSLLPSTDIVVLPDSRLHNGNGSSERHYASRGTAGRSSNPLRISRDLLSDHVLHDWHPTQHRHLAENCQARKRISECEINLPKSISFRNLREGGVESRLVKLSRQLMFAHIMVLVVYGLWRSWWIYSFFWTQGKGSLPLRGSSCHLQAISCVVSSPSLRLCPFISGRTSSLPSPSICSAALGTLKEGMNE